MKVKFVPQNVEFEVNPDQSVMKLAHQNGIYIKSICGGLPSCAECRVRVTDGDQNVLPPSSKELTLIGTGYFIDQRRLSCQLKCFGDVTIDLTEQVAKQQVVETRRPQGSKKPETEASHAVSGNLIQQDDALKTVAEDIEKRDQQGSRQGRGQGGGGGGRNRGGRNRNQNPSSNQRAQQGSGNEQSTQGQQPRQNNNQNPNRGNPGNRNNNRGGGQQGASRGRGGPSGGGGGQGGRGSSNQGQ